MLLRLSLLGNAQQVGLHSPELGQVESGDLLGLLNLLLVGLDLALQLVDQGLHPLMVLPVLILLVSELLDVPLRLPELSRVGKQTQSRATLSKILLKIKGNG